MVLKTDDRLLAGRLAVNDDEMGTGFGAQFLIFDFFVVCSALLLLIVGLGEKVAFSSTVRPIDTPPYHNCPLPSLAPTVTAPPKRVALSAIVMAVIRMFLSSLSVSLVLSASPKEVVSLHA